MIQNLQTTKPFPLLLAACVFYAMATQPVFSGDLTSSLVQAYMHNPELKAEQEQLKTIDEQASQSFSGWLPNLSLLYQRGEEKSQIGSAPEDQYTTTSRQLNFSQPLFRGGRTIAEMGRAKYEVLSARAALTDTEQNILFDAVRTYMDVLRDQEIFRLHTENESVLNQHLQSTEQRFSLGEVTRTDVAQSAARLSRAVASRIEAEGQLQTSKATYRRLVGDEPRGLITPALPSAIPATLDEVLKLALQHNPQALQARYREASAQKDISVNRSSLFPQVSFNTNIARDDGSTTFSGGSVDSEKYYVNVTIPLYQSGAEYSRIRQAKLTASSRAYTIKDTENRIYEAAIASWEDYQVAKASIKSQFDAVKAATIAKEGIKQEMDAGTRTVLDVLDQEQELFTAKVNLVRSQRDEIVYAFGLMRLTGSLTAAALQLPVTPYDSTAYYDRVKYRPF